MIPRWLLLAGALCLLGVAPWVSAAERSVKDALDLTSAERQLLVMLRLPPAHFRPDANYAGGSDWQTGRDARRRIAAEIAAKHGLKLVTGWPMPALWVDCFVMEVPAADSLAHLVEQLSQDTRVESVQSMNLFHMLGHNDPLYALQPGARLWHLAEVHQVTTGKGVLVAEVDTGVEAEHPDLIGQVTLSRNFVDGSTYAAEVHGTAVAGIIAARADDGVGIAGVAPHARLMALRACWQESATSDAALCSSFTLAKALQFALDYDAQVINLSLGGPRDRLLERLMDAALSRGITIVSAVDSRLNNGGFPAYHAGVLAVTGDGGSNAAVNVLLAPGRDIPTTIPGGRWGFVTGSSFAAAHVTGMVALLRELTPRIQAPQVRAALSPPAAALGAVRPVMIDACAAIARAAGGCPCACAVTREVNALQGQ